MNQKIKLFYLFILTVALDSCNASCDCKLDVSCKLITTISKSSSDIVDKKAICQAQNWDENRDSILSASVDSFIKSIDTAANIVIIKDSSFKDIKNDVNRDKISNRLAQNNYLCNCDK